MQAKITAYVILIAMFRNSIIVVVLVIIIIIITAIMCLRFKNYKLIIKKNAIYFLFA